MKHSHRFVGIAVMFCIVIVLFITSVEAVVYQTPGHFEKEYTKYSVLESLPAMTMDDLLEVTDQMMDYLEGDCENLHVTTTMRGQQREFFSERGIAHMESVQVLLLKAVSIRRICLATTALLPIFMVTAKGRTRQALPSSLYIGYGLSFGLITALALIVSTDFSKYFVMFRHIFFTNDLWILDPAADMLINIAPEGFFVGTTARIAGFFGALSLILFGFCLFLTVRSRKEAA